jgi:ATP dependent DNA ligase domain
MRLLWPPGQRGSTTDTPEVAEPHSADFLQAVEIQRGPGLSSGRRKQRRLSHSVEGELHGQSCKQHTGYSADNVGACLPQTAHQRCDGRHGVVEVRSYNPSDARPPTGATFALRPQWVHEIKLDGFRMAARLDNGRVQLLTRTGLDWTAKYPSAVAALAALTAKTAYIDGELCGVDAAGLPSFAQTQAATDGERRVHLVYYAFDLLHLAGWDISSLPLIRRKELLEPLVANRPGLQFNGHDAGDGELILQHAGKLGFEGIVSKTIDAPYAPGNRGLWRKAKALNRQEFVVGGRSRNDPGRISGRSCLATTPMMASSHTPVVSARACPSRCSPICGAAWTP